MRSNELTLVKDKRKSYFMIYLIIIILITLILIALRIIFYNFQEESSGSFFIDLLLRNRDLNFKTNYDLMNNGFIQYYEENPLTNEKAIYLYFWYFIFYPFYSLPLEVSVYIWDLLRFISTIYIAIKLKNLIKTKRDLLYFLLFSGIGYFADMYLNNTNWLIQLLVYGSYIQLEKDKKVFSGILFTLAAFKITLILIPFIFILIKKIKWKDLIYYLLPLILICLPYIIFPGYFLSMISNWYSSAEASTSLQMLNFFLIIWRLIQPAQLMFVSILVVILILNIKNEKKRYRIKSLIYLSVFIIWILFWVILLELALFI